MSSSQTRAVLLRVTACFPAAVRMRQRPQMKTAYGCFPDIESKASKADSELHLILGDSLVHTSNQLKQLGHASSDRCRALAHTHNKMLRQRSQVMHDEPGDSI